MVDHPQWSVSTETADLPPRAAPLSTVVGESTQAQDVAASELMTGIPEGVKACAAVLAGYLTARSLTVLASQTIPSPSAPRPTVLLVCRSGATWEVVQYGPGCRRPMSWHHDHPAQAWKRFGDRGSLLSFVRKEG